MWEVVIVWEIVVVQVVRIVVVLNVLVDLVGAVGAEPVFLRDTGTCLIAVRLSAGVAVDWSTFRSGNLIC